MKFEHANCGSVTLKIRAVRNMRAYAILMLTSIILQGCVQPMTDDTRIAEPRQNPAITLPKVEKAGSMQVAILVNEDTPAYAEVAKILAIKLGQQSTIYNLADSQLENAKTVARLKNEDDLQIVSIGLNASLAAKVLTQKQVVFCQVFNYQDHGLITSRHKGVSMLPSLPKTFSAWRSLSPKTVSIGVISGPGLEDLMLAARQAAKTNGFTLQHVVVNSDKEYQYAYKKMSKEVQAFWLIPDNRVLSEHVLRDLMNFSVRNSKQVAVFNDELLKLGGLLSIKTNNSDIAQQVIERLEQSRTLDNVAGPDIVYPEKINLRINPVMARNLNLTIPEKYRKHAHAL